MDSIQFHVLYLDCTINPDNHSVKCCLDGSVAMLKLKKLFLDRSFWESLCSFCLIYAVIQSDCGLISKTMTYVRERLYWQARKSRLCWFVRQLRIRLHGRKDNSTAFVPGALGGRLSSRTGTLMTVHRDLKSCSIGNLWIWPKDTYNCVHTQAGAC